MMSFERVLVANRSALAEQWEALFKRPPPPNIQIGLIRRILTWHAQAHKAGSRRRGSGSADASPSTASAADLDRLFKPSGRAGPRLNPGTRLLREWKGATHEVLVLDEGFAYNGATFKSLTAIATTITGTPWSGPAFFGVKR